MGKSGYKPFSNSLITRFQSKSDRKLFPEAFYSEEECWDVMYRYTLKTSKKCLNCSLTAGNKGIKNKKIEFKFIFSNKCRRCSECFHQVTVLSFTPLKATKTPLQIWFKAFHLWANSTLINDDESSRNGVLQKRSLRIKRLAQHCQVSDAMAKKMKQCFEGKEHQKSFWFELEASRGHLHHAKSEFRAIHAERGEAPVSTRRIETSELGDKIDWSKAKSL